MVSAALVVAAVSARPVEARADIHLSANLGGALLVSEYQREASSWEGDLGLTTAVTAGWELRSGLVSFVPELAFGGGVFSDPYGRRIITISGGGRLSYGRAYRPFFATHVGWGFEEGVDGDALLEHRGTALDSSLGLEVPFDEHWSMSAQVTYRVLLASTGSGTSPEHWPGAGVAFALRP